MGAPRHGRGRRPSWPPTAEPAGIELSTAAVLAIFLVMEGVAYAAWTLTVGRPFTVVGWIWDPTVTAVARQGIAEPVFELLFWALVLSALGWVRASGLVAGRISAWGVVPLALFWLATLMVAGLTGVIDKGGGFVALAFVGVSLAALTEEIAFRGFLYHGLTRTIGGRAAVIAGSVLFALVHLPKEVWGYDHEAGVVAGTLFLHFCFGVVMCRIRAATGAVWFPAGVHALSNLTIVGIGRWAFPEAEAVPAAFPLLQFGLLATGLLLAYGLLMGARWRMWTRQVAIMMRLDAAERETRAKRPRASTETPGPGPDRATSSGSVFERFTSDARVALVLAHEEARAQGASATDTEHLLLGLVGEPTWISARALERLRVGSRPSTGRIEPPMDHGEAASAPAIRFTPRAKLAIAVAISEADRLGHADVGPEHLLLGVVADRRGGAARVLRRLKISPTRARRSVLELAPPRQEPAVVPDVGPATPEPSPPD